MENVIGVAAEYNPFHLGHLYHLERSREMLGGGTLVCVMSGSFVQRGECAVFRKHARAEAAVRAGADLVLELPLPWALSSAEGFARGCVGLLGALGVVTHMSFGAECADLRQLSAVATALCDPKVDAMIGEELQAGDSYAAARQRALHRAIGGELAELVREPNNILAIEYLKALNTQRLSITPIAVERLGTGHDRMSAPESDAPRAARELRALLAAGQDISAFLPEAAAEVYRRETEQGRGPVTMQALEMALLARLRGLTEADFAVLPDASEGVEKRLYRAAATEPSFDAVLAAAAAKRYPLSRLRRMLLGAALGLRAGMADGIPPYARVLAANSAGTALLRRISERAKIPVLTKSAASKALDARGQEIFALGAKAEDLYVLGFGAVAERAGGSDWRSSPYIEKGESAR